MTTEHKTNDVNPILESLKCFNSGGLENAKSFYFLRGERTTEITVSELTILVFVSDVPNPTDEIKGKLDMVMLGNTANIKKYFGIVSDLRELILEDINDSRSPFQNEAQAINYSKKKKIPYAVLYAGHIKDKKDMVITLQTLKSIEPEEIFRVLQGACKQQFTLLNQPGQI